MDIDEEILQKDKRNKRLVVRIRWPFCGVFWLLRRRIKRFIDAVAIINDSQYRKFSIRLDTNDNLTACWRELGGIKDEIHDESITAFSCVLNCSAPELP